MPVLAAGGTFALTAVAGLLVGAWLAARMRSPVLAVAGFALGMALGGYSAYRLLTRSI